MTALTSRRIVYLSGTRADFGLMESTLILAAQSMDVRVIATGMHLDADLGHTVDDIRASGLPVVAEIPIDVCTRTPAAMAAAVGVCLDGVTTVLEAFRPDLLVLLGDRGEMLAGAIAALHLGIPTLHIHGGERSGTVDEPVRHAISKLATHHAVATAGSRQRLIRMGEWPERITVTGAPGLDDAIRLAQDEAHEEWRLQVGIAPQFLLVVFHPVVQQAASAYSQTRALCEAVFSVGLPVLWLLPNADAGSLGVLQALEEHPLPTGSVRLAHLVRPLYLRVLREAAALLGNSSSGIVEAASFGTPVVNVGDRQRLRERNANTVDVAPEKDDIEAALRAALVHGKYQPDNVYGDGRAAPRISRLLQTLPLNAALLEKVNAY